ncbi:MAG: TPR Domain containing protein [Candidatus Curtissbacteria bacterium GW2011_GWA1_40_16]|uniref:TPR Domain containing protein n=1 Tax=Candidatus Curtissbacteria bacterium GW2011_GWA1_40_16 TaxID=1618405 RepID=A0A0G0REU4_9BACT|nr:MAG: TPR Domain containing protein [Candidatus Curtissbacteria bacterium GW2011_GWA1_40_16]
MNVQPQKTPSILPVVVIFIIIFSLLTAAVGAIYYFFLLPKITNNTSSIEVSNLFREASKNFAEGKYSLQLESANKALNKSTTDKERAIAYYWKGLAEYKLASSDKTQAQQDLTEATRLDSTYAAPYVTLSAIEMDSGNFQGGLTLAQKCATLDPKYAWCENNIGLALFYLGQKQEGIKHLEKAVQISPDTLVFRDNLNRARQN